MIQIFRFLGSFFLRSKKKDPNIVKEAENVVSSISKAKKLHRVLITKAHPDRHENKELATELSTLINQNRYNYDELLKLTYRVNNELME